MSPVLRLEAEFLNENIFTEVCWNIGISSLTACWGSHLLVFLMSLKTDSSHQAELFSCATWFTWMFRLASLGSTSLAPLTSHNLHVCYLNADDPPKFLSTPWGKTYTFPQNSLKSNHSTALFIEEQQQHVRLATWAGKEGGTAPSVRSHAVPDHTWAKPGSQAREQSQNQLCTGDTFPHVVLKEKFSLLGISCLKCQLKTNIKQYVQ